MVTRNLVKVAILLCAALPSVASAQSWSDRADADLAANEAQLAAQRMEWAVQEMEDARRDGNRLAEDWARIELDAAIAAARSAGWR